MKPGICPDYSRIFEMKLKIIKRFDKDCHFRNIQISKAIAQGNNYKKVSKLFNISHTRVSQVYRVLMAHLCEQYFSVPWHIAVMDKKFYNHSERLQMIITYERFYMIEKGLL